MAEIPDFEETELPEGVTDAERKHALRLINVDPSDESPLEKRLAINHDNTSMLCDKGKLKKATTAERIRSLFQQHNFSPVASLVRLVKIEEAKMEARHRAENMGLSQRMLDALPKADKRFYADLCKQLARYEVPELKSVEINGQVEIGMQVSIVQHTPQPKIIKVDQGAPDSIKKIYGTSTDDALIAKEVAVEIVGKSIDDI